MRQRRGGGAAVRKAASLSPSRLPTLLLVAALVAAVLAALVTRGRAERPTSTSKRDIKVEVGTEEVEVYGVEANEDRLPAKPRDLENLPDPRTSHISTGHHKNKKRQGIIRASDIRAADGCPADCGMIRDAFSSGQCVNGTCKCLPGWGGTACTSPLGQPPVAGDPACNPRCGAGVFWAVGMCNTDTGKCECAEGWGGPFCGFNENYPLSKGLENVDITGVQDDRNNGGSVQPTTKPIIDTSGGCPYYEFASGLPMMCGPNNGNKRCPAGLCCSQYGYCGGAGLITVKSKISGRAPAHLYERGNEDQLERWEWERHLLVERSWCYGARSIGGGKKRMFEFAFQAEEAEMGRLKKRNMKRNCARHTLEERTSFCSRNNICCSSSLCKRMTLEERNNACSRKRNNGGGCCPLPPCPPTPPTAYCGDGCQPNYGKCLSSTASCTGVITATPTRTVTGIIPTNTGGFTATSTNTLPSGHTSTITTPLTQTTNTLPDGHTSTSSRTTYTISVAAQNIYQAMSFIVDGSIQKDYKLNLQKAEVDQYPKIVAILAANTTATGFSNITFFASIDAGWEKFKAPRRHIRELRAQLMEANTAEEHAFVKRQSTPAQRDNVGEVLAYNILPVVVNRFSLAPKVLAPTALQNGTLSLINPQYMVLITAGGGNGFFPTYGTFNTTVIDQVVTLNGVMYVTETVIVPPLPPTSTTTGAGLTEYAAFLGNTTVTNDTGSPLWSAQMDAYGLPNQNGLTIFAPINAAFTDATAAETFATFTSSDWSNVLAYSAVVVGQGVYYSSDFTDGMTLQTVQGDNLTIAIQDGTVFVDGVQVLLLDVLTDNGVIHVVNEVLIPPTFTAEGRGSKKPKAPSKLTNVIVSDRVRGLVPIARKITVDPEESNTPAEGEGEPAGQVDSGSDNQSATDSGGDPMTDSGAVGSGGDLWSKPPRVRARSSDENIEY